MTPWINTRAKRDDEAIGFNVLGDACQTSCAKTRSGILPDPLLSFSEIRGRMFDSIKPHLIRRHSFLGEAKDVNLWRMFYVLNH